MTTAEDLASQVTGSLSSASNLAQNLGTSLNLEGTLSVIMNKLRNLVSFDTGAVYLVEEKTSLIVPAHVEGENAERVRRKT